MRIHSINIQEGRIGGLKKIQATRLGKVVILAGRNGAGKSRLIQFLHNWKNNECLAGMPLDMNTPKGFIKWAEPQLEAELSKEKFTWNGWCSNSAWVLKSIRPWLNDKVNADLYRARLMELEFDAGDEPELIHFIPKQIGLADPMKQTKHDLVSRADRAAKGLGIDDLEHDALARIQHLQDRYKEATHQNCKLDEALILKIKQDYETLQGLVEQFLGARLDRDADGNTTLFGFRLGAGHYSDGQSILLQFCVAVHAQAHRLSELIVLMDEPENHLHPAAMLDAIDQIQKHLTTGQLWIATHSVTLLSNFDPDCIWWMDQGQISHAGSRPEMVLEGLLGTPERLDRLEAFLGLPAAMALNNFAAQCLLPPQVVTTGSEDKQLQQIQASLASLNSLKERLRVLDVGAGRGRLISSLTATWPDVSQRIDYLAFDPSSAYQAECEAAIARCYPGSKQKRWFGREVDLKAQHSAHSIDIAVMCNVLHEIDPCRWLESIFGPNGIVGYFASEDGYLLVVEDTEMRIGELAHNNGFLVLNPGNLRTLFAITERDTGFRSDARFDGRLVATTVPASCLKRASHSTLRNVLEQVKYEAGEAIRMIRQSKEATTYRNGRKLAFQMQQFANACLSLSNMV